MSAMLEVRDLHKRFGGLGVLEGVHLAVESGEIHCLIGPNGAGKSTLFKLMVGIYEPSEGEVFFRGEDVTARRPYERVMRGMSIKMQVPSVFRELPVAQNLVIALQQRLRRDQIPAEVERLLGLLDLQDQAQTLAGDLSHGQQQWLEIGMALALDPVMLLLDEPTAGMSRSETAHFVALVRELAQGRTLLVVEHDLGVVFELAERIAVLVRGEIIAFDTPAAIRADPRVQEAYLGQALAPAPGSGVA